MATREAFVRGGAEADIDHGEEAGGPDRRDHFTPLWKTKGAHSFGGGLLQPVPSTGGIPGSMLVESEGFVPLRKVCMCVFFRRFGALFRWGDAFDGGCGCLLVVCCR